MTPETFCLYHQILNAWSAALLQNFSQVRAMQAWVQLQVFASCLIRSGIILLLGVLVHTLGLHESLIGLLTAHELILAQL